MQGADSALLRKFLGRRTGICVVEWKYPYPPQKPPDALIVLRIAVVAQVRAKCPNEGTHVVVCRALPCDPRQESLVRTQFSRPFQHVLVGPIDLARRSG